MSNACREAEKRGRGLSSAPKCVWVTHQGSGIRKGCVKSVPGNNITGIQQGLVEVGRALVFFAFVFLFTHRCKSKLNLSRGSIMIGCT